MKKINQAVMLLLLASIGFIACESSEFGETGALVPPLVTEDASLPSIVVNGALLHSEAFGDPSDPMIITIHGGPGVDYRSILNFKDIADDGYYVVFYDQRGAGLSQREDAAYYEDKVVQIFIDDLAGVIDHYRSDESQKLILAGHSWGAMLATAYVNQNPDKVDQVILAEPGGLTYPQLETYVTKTFKPKIFEETTNDLVYTDQFLTGTSHDIIDYRLAFFMTAANTGDPTPQPFWRLGAEQFWFVQTYGPNNPEDLDFTANLSQYEEKVLFVYSENNEHYGLEHAQLVSAAYPNVQLEQIENCGHEIVHFGWDSFYPKIKAYLK